MQTPTAVYLDLCDLQSARVWRWLGSLGLQDCVEVRPFSNEVDDPWDCTSPPYTLELLMLLEQAREHGVDAMRAVIDGAFGRLGAVVESAHAELAAWLAIGTGAGLSLDEYDLHMEQLRAEVGLWMAEAQEDHHVRRSPTLLFGDVSVYLQLDVDVRRADEARDLMRRVVGKIDGVGSGPAAR